MPDVCSGRDSEARAVQGGRGLRPGESAALRAAVVGGGVSASSASRRPPARRASIGATDVEQVLRIKHLLLVDGLTLAGARRRLEEESAPVAADAPAIDELIGRNARERLTEVKRGLRSILSSCCASSERADELRLAVAGCRRAARVRSMPREDVREGKRRRRGTDRRGRRRRSSR